MLQTTEFFVLLDILLALFFAKLMEEAMIRLKQAPVLGDILAGIIVGPTVLGLITSSENIMPIAWLGIVILIFMAGFEADIKEFRRYGTKAALVGLGGVIACFGLGYFIGLMWGYPLHTSLFIGAILTPTSVGVTVSTLTELGIIHKETGYVILGAAVFDDIYGVIVLTIVYSLISEEGLSLSNYGPLIVGGSILALIVAIIPRFTYHIERLIAHIRISEAPFILLLLLGMGGATLSAYFGLTPIPGAFLMGLALSGIHSPEALRTDFEVLERVITPLFFVLAGILLNPWIAAPSEVGVTLILAIIGAGLLGKVLGCGLVARAVGVKIRNALGIGVAMMPRAGVDIVIAVVGLSLGIIDQTIYLSALSLIYVSSLLTPPLAKALLKHR